MSDTVGQVMAEEGVSALVAVHPDSDEQAVDLAGVCKGLESRLAERRRMLLSEVAGDVTTDDWALEQRRVAKRTYNDDRILSELLNATEVPNLLDLLLILRDRDVVRFGWQWSKLKRLLEDWAVDLHVHAGEVMPGDDALVGEVWQTRPNLSPVVE